MTRLQTLKSYVNTWNCDENDHLNVQFYFQFFEDAGDHFQALAGVPRAERRRPDLRHVRYHSELRVNEAVHIETHGVGDRQAVHLLYETISGRLSATCLETYADPPAALAGALAQYAGDLPETASPRSLDLAAAKAGDGASPPGSVLALRTRVRAQHCDADGRAFDSAFVGFNSDAAAHFWDVVGFNRPWLDARTLGRVAVEMKFSPTGRAAFGDLLHVVSRPFAVARSTITFENRFVLTDTGEVAAIIHVTALTMNLTTRRAEPLPEDMRANIAARIAGGNAPA